MKQALIAAALALAATPLPAQRASRTQQQDAATVSAVQDAIAAGKPLEALRLIEPIRARLEAEASRHKQRIYSGQTPEQTLSYMLMAGAAKTEAIDVGPMLGEANFWSAFALTDAGRAAEAGPYFERAVALSPLNPHYLCELGHWHAVRKHADLGLDFYQRCLDNAAMGPKESERHNRAVALRGKGYVLIDIGRLDEAERAYRESLMIEPDNPVALKDLHFIAEQRANPGRGKV